MHVLKFYERLFQIKSENTLKFGTGKIFSAFSFGFVVQTLIALFSIPLYLHFLGTESYANWLKALFLAQFSSLFDFGSITTTQNKMVQFIDNEKFELANARLRQISNILLANTLIFCSSLFIIDAVFNLGFNPLLASIFVMSNVLNSSIGLYEARMRVGNRMAKAIIVVNILRLLEFLTTILVMILFSKNVLIISITALIAKILFITVFSLSSRRDDRFIHVGDVNFKLMRVLALEGMPLLLFRFIDFILLSGSLLYVSHFISAKELVLISTLRAFFRLGLQLLNLIVATNMYQMSNAWSEANFHRFRGVFTQNYLVCLTLLLFGVVLYGLFGRQAFELWTGTQFRLSTRLLYLGILYLTLSSLSVIYRAKFQSINFNSYPCLISAVGTVFGFSLLIIFRNVLDPFLILLAISLVEILNLLFLVLYPNKRFEVRFINLHFGASK